MKALEELDFMALDREVRRAAHAWRRWRRELREGVGLEDDPLLFARELTSRETFRALGEIQADPLTGPLRRWLYRLIDERVNRDTLVELARVARIEPVPVEHERERFPRRELLKRALRDPARRAGWLRALIDAGEPVATLTSFYWERRAELAGRAGVGSPDRVELPCEEIARVAEAWLALTDDAMRELGVRDLPALIEIALASQARDGWPARLSPRVVRELLRDLAIFDGIELDPGRLPDTVAPSSFLRGLARVGSAWVDATAPARQPFVVAHDPYGLRRRSIGALFGTLPLAPSFLRRRFELGRGRAREHARALTAAVFVESRALALRVLLRGPALSGRSALLESYQALVERVFGIGLPASAAGSIFKLNVDDPQRFAGLLLGLSHAERLIDEHDEDWFRNPRAADQLRSEAELSPNPTIEPSALDEAAKVSRQTLLSAL